MLEALLATAASCSAPPLPNSVVQTVQSAKSSDSTSSHSSTVTPVPTTSPNPTSTVNTDVSNVIAETPPEELPSTPETQFINCSFSLSRDGLVTKVNSTSKIDALTCQLKNSDSTTAKWSNDNFYDYAKQAITAPYNFAECASGPCSNIRPTVNTTANSIDESALCPKDYFVAAPADSANGIIGYFCARFESNGRPIKYRLQSSSGNVEKVVARNACPSGAAVIGWHMQKTTPQTSSSPTNSIYNTSPSSVYRYSGKTKGVVYNTGTTANTSSYIYGTNSVSSQTTEVIDVTCAYPTL